MSGLPLGISPLQSFSQGYPSPSTGVSTPTPSTPSAPGPKGASDYPMGPRVSTGFPEPGSRPTPPAGFDENLGYDPSDPYSGAPAINQEFRTKEQEEQLRRDLYQRRYGERQPERSPVEEFNEVRRSSIPPAGMAGQPLPFRNSIRRQPQLDYVNYDQFMPRQMYQQPMFGGMYGMPSYGMPSYGMPSYGIGGIGGMYGMNPMMGYQRSPFMGYGIGGFNPFMRMFG